MDQSENATLKNDILTTFRHLVLAAMAAFIHPFWVIGFDTGLEQSVGIFIGSVSIACVITGLAYLFSPKAQARIGVEISIVLCGL